MEEHGRRSRGFRYALYALLHSPTALIGVSLVLTIVIMAVFAPQIAPYDPYQLDVPQRLEGPSTRHLFGTDDVGRDLFSRVVYGSRTALLITFVVISIACIFGTLFGAVSGYLGGMADTLMMRIVDIFLAIPSLLFALVAVAVLGPSLYNMMLGLSIGWWTWHARIVRGEVLRLKETRFILAERAMGASPLRVIFRHLIPNCAGPIIVQTTEQCGLVILTAASLSYLGLGPRPPAADWGYMIAVGRNYLPAQWWLSTFPGLAIVVLVLGFLLLGDYLRDYLAREVK
jgi:peptide/nickel transport system permease protein